MRRPIVLIKIPLEKFIDILVDLYDNGADFVDIYGVPDQNQDFMSVGVRLAYINPERDKFEDGQEIIKNQQQPDNKQIPDTTSEENLEELI